jgi:hypothetical protein
MTVVKPAGWRLSAAALERLADLLAAAAAAAEKAKGKGKK